jgi:ferric-dicitrate binding protein FerR (iron transport regulator)
MTDHELPDELDRFEHLMTAAIDGELSSAEQEEFERLLDASPERRDQWHRYQELKGLTMQMRFRDPPEEVWDRYWHDVYNRIERRLGWILVSIGAIILLSYAGFHAVESIVTDPDMPWPLKVAILAVLVGAVILFISVVREKLFTWKTDKYKEIQR